MISSRIVFCCPKDFQALSDISISHLLNIHLIQKQGSMYNFYKLFEEK